MPHKRDTKRPKRDSNSVIKRTHVPLEHVAWVFDELQMRIGVKEAISWVGCGYPTWYNWKHRRFWRVDRKFVKAAMITLLEVRREQDGWTPEEAQMMRKWIQNVRQSILAKKMVAEWDHHNQRSENGNFAPNIDPELTAKRLAENAINQEELGNEVLASRARERAANLASTNGVAGEVHVRSRDSA